MLISPVSSETLVCGIPWMKNPASGRKMADNCEGCSSAIGVSICKQIQNFTAQPSVPKSII